MYVTDVRALFDVFVDEPDTTFLTVAQRRTALASAYEKFRSQVMACEERAYATEVDIAITGTNEYDLGGATSAVRLLGPTPTVTERLIKLHRVGLLDTQSPARIRVYLPAARDLSDFAYDEDFGDTAYNVPSYTFINSKLLLSHNITASLRLFYTAASAVDWTLDASGDTEYIDDFERFHNLIALYAARDYYTTRDAMVHQRLQQQIEIEETEMRRELGSGRFVELTGVKESW